MFQLYFGIIDNFINFDGFPFFLGFPIQGVSGDMGEYFPLSEKQRIIYSIIFYLIFLTTLFTIPLYLTKCFKKTSFYLIYKKLWYIGIILFEASISMLIGITPKGMGLFEAIIFYSIFSIVLYVLIITPADIQHRNGSRFEK